MAKATIPQTSELPRISHTAIEYDTVRKELQEHLFKSFPDTWNDFLEGNAGQVFLEMVSFFADMVSFRIDAISNENFLGTAQNREHVLRLLELIDYQMMAIQQSSVTVEANRIDTDTSIVNDIVLHDPNKNIRTELVGNNKNDEQQVFTVLSKQFDYETAVVVPRVKDYVDGQLTTINPDFTNVLAYQGIVREDTIDNVTGEDNQTYFLESSPVVYNSVKVLINKGDGWELLNNNQHLVSEKVQQDGTSSLPVFRLEWDSDNKVKITFGSDQYGNKPETGYRLKFQYMIGGGKDGNIGQNGIDVTQTCQNVFLNKIVGNSKIRFVNRDLPGLGGRDKETVEEAKVFAPLLLRTAWKTTTREDYNILITSLANIRLARVESDLENDLVPKYTSHVRVVPDGIELFKNYYELSPDIHQKVLNYLDGTEEEVSHKIIGLDNKVLPAKLMEFGVYIKAVKNKHYNTEVIESEIINILKNYFNPQLTDDNATNNPDFDFGRVINKDKIEVAIQAIKGVNYVEDINIIVKSPLQTFKKTYSETVDLMLPVYPNHEEIKIATKEQSSGATIELLYDVPEFDSFDTKYDEYIDDDNDVVLNNNVYNTYKQLSNNKLAIDFTGHSTSRNNNWLRFAYAEQDSFSFRKKVYTGTDSVITDFGITTSTEAVVKNFENSCFLVTDEANALLEGETYGGKTSTTFETTLLLEIKNKTIKINFPLFNDEDYEDTPFGVANFINNHVRKTFDLNKDMLEVIVEKHKTSLGNPDEQVFYKLSFNSLYEITVLNSELYYLTTSTINTSIGLPLGKAGLTLKENYLPCSENVLLKEDANQLLLRINDRKEKVTLPISTPTCVFTNQFVKQDAGLGGQDIRAVNPLIFTTFPYKYSVNSEVTYKEVTNGWKLNVPVIEEDGEEKEVLHYIDNKDLALVDERDAKSISRLFIRIQKKSNGMYLQKEPVLTIGASFYKWYDEIVINGITYKAGLYSVVKNEAGLWIKEGVFEYTDQQYYYLKTNADSGWLEIGEYEEDGKKLVDMNLNNYNSVFGNGEEEPYKVSDALSEISNNVYDTKQDLQKAVEQITDKVNQFFFPFSFENSLENETGFENNVEYSIEIKARKNYDTTTRIVDSIESAVTNTKIFFKQKDDALGGLYSDWNDVDFQSIETVKNYVNAEIEEEIIDNRCNWINDEYREIQQSKVKFGFSTIEAVDTVSDSTVLEDSDVVVSAKILEPDIEIETISKTSLKVESEFDSDEVSTIDSSNNYTILCSSSTFSWDIDYMDFGNTKYVSLAGSFFVESVVTGVYVIRLKDIKDAINASELGKYVRAFLKEDGTQIILKSLVKQIKLISFDSGTGQVVSNNQITLSNEASVIDDFYKDWTVSISGTERIKIVSYNGTTKLAVLESNTTQSGIKSYKLFRPNNIFETLFKDNKTIINKTDIEINYANLFDPATGSELLSKGNVYSIEIVLTNDSSSNKMKFYIPFYYFMGLGYSGALNRRNIKDAIVEQIPNINNTDNDIIVADENEIALLNEDEIVIEIS